MRVLSLTSPACVFRLLCFAVFFTPLLLGQAPGGQGEADIVLHNGKIVTVDESFSVAEAVAISGNQFHAVGPNQAVLQLAGPGTLVIDLKGRTVVPGLVDTHRHIYSYAERAYGEELGPVKRKRYPVDWRGVRSKEDALNQIQGLMEKYQFKPGEWVYFQNRLQFIGGGSVEQAKILYDDLNRWELDKVTPDNPVILSLGIPDFNGFLVNSTVIDMLWAEHGDFITKNGRYWVDSGGRPDGHLEPPASRLILPFTYDRDPEDLAVMYRKDLAELASMGVTTVSSRMPPDSYEAYKYMAARGELTLRLGSGMLTHFGTVTDLDQGMKGLGELVGSGDDKLWVTSVGPTAVDGASTRACTNQKRIGGAYGVIDGWFPMGQCHNDIEYRGAQGRAAPIQENYYRNWTFASARNRVRFANTHVAGDRSVGVLLTMMEQIQQQMGPSATQGWAFDHCDMVDPADFERAARVGVTFSCYAMNIERASRVAASYGEEVAHTFLSPVKSMLDAGVKVVFESDRNSYEWVDLELFMTRKDLDGKVWGPQEKVDRVTALKMITSWAADYVLKGDKLGSIEPGKLADLVVLDRDYMTIPEEQVSEIQPQITMLDGEVIFVHPNFAEEYNFRPSGALVTTYQELLAKRPEGSR